jgi:steroid delta-isomerase-like uncharacterized protein
MQLPDIVTTYMDTFCRHDVDAFVATFATNGTYQDPGTGQPISGQAIKGYIGALFGAYPDATFETVGVYAITDNLVVWRWVMHGTHTGSFAGLSPTGRRIQLPGCEFIEVLGDKIERVEAYHDRMTLLEQLGIMPRPPAAAGS